MISKSQEETEVAWHLEEKTLEAGVGWSIFRPSLGSSIPIHPHISAIEFILKHLTPKSLRRPHPSASLLMDSFEASRVHLLPAWLLT